MQAHSNALTAIGARLEMLRRERKRITDNFEQFLADGRVFMVNDKTHDLAPAQLAGIDAEVALLEDARRKITQQEVSQ